MALKVYGIARLTRDPESKVSKGGEVYCKLGLASDVGYGDRKKTCFLDATAFGKTAEMAINHLAKGRQILVEGELNLDTWEQDGAKRSKHTLTVNRIEFVGPRPADDGERPPSPPRRQADDDDTW